MVDELGLMVKDKSVFAKAVRLSRCRSEGAAEGQLWFRTAVRLNRVHNARPHRWMS